MKLTLLEHLRASSNSAKQFAQRLAAQILNAAAADVQALGETKQDKISGTAGQVVIFDGEGNLSADNAPWLGANYGPDGQVDGYDADGNPIYNVRGITFAGEAYPDGEEQVLLVRRGSTLDLESGVLCAETPDEDNPPDDGRNVVNKRYLRNTLGNIAAVLDSINGEAV